MINRCLSTLVIGVLIAIIVLMPGNEFALASNITQSSSLQESTATPETDRLPMFATASDVRSTELSPLIINNPPTPQDLAYAMGINASDVVSASLNGSDSRGAGIGTTMLGQFFPTEGSTFVILSTGLAASADDPNASEGLSFRLDGLNNSQGNDLTQLALKLRVPANMNCASFDFAYYSEEFLEYVGSRYNDAFTAEKGGTNLSIVNNQVVAPLNFAFDTEGNVISVNTVFGVATNTGTTYDGGTALLRARTPATPGSVIDIVFSVQDLGDSIYDAAVFLDKFFWSNDPGCGGSAQEDSDGDGLLDIWETEGLTVSVDGINVFVPLHLMGADPNKKDIFVEIDYMVDDGVCFPVIGCILGHSHLPKQKSIDPQIIDAFLNSPIDGNKGINLHVDYGPDSVMNPLTGATWGTLSESNSLPHDVTLGFKLSNGNYDWTEFDQIKESNFSKARAAVFHYVVFAHNLGGFDTISGISRGAPASDFIVSMGSFIFGGSPDQQAGTFMHELGHNLGLCHGGERDAPEYKQCVTNYKPNYLSIMNYFFQTRGLRINGQDGHFDYSRFELPSLNENDLNETVGLNGGNEVIDFGSRYFCDLNDDRVINKVNDPINWNCDLDTSDFDISENINEGITNVHDTQFTELKSYNDWANLVFTGGAIGQPGADPELLSETKVEEIAQEDDALLISPYKVAVSASGDSIVSPGQTVNQTITVTNLGDNTDTYVLIASSSQGWADLSNIPITISLAPRTSFDIPITINVPVSANSFDTDILSFSAVSQANPMIEDIVTVHTTVIGPKALSIERTYDDQTNSSIVGFRVTFLVPVTGVDISDFGLSTTGVAGASILTVDGSDTSYTVIVGTGTGNGTIGLNVVDNDSIRDVNNIPLGGVGVGNGNFVHYNEFYTIDKSAYVDVAIGGINRESLIVPPQTGQRVAYSLDNGPVKIESTNGVPGTTPFIAALRVIWKEPGYRSSYSEMMGLPEEQLSTEYWFPWYNNAVPASMDQGFRIANVDTSSSNTVEVWVGTSKLDTITLAPGASIRKGYPVDNGPINIICTTCDIAHFNDRIIAALRVIWKESGYRSSYSEMMGLPKEQLSSEYWFPWYNNAVSASMDQGFRIANVSSTESNTVEVSVGNTKLDTITLGTGASIRVSYNVDNGPIKILCTSCSNMGDDKIIAALRVIWKEPGFRASYSEMMGLPKEELSSEYWFPWYNNAVPSSMDQGFRIANVSPTESNTVEVWVGTTKLATIPLAAGASTRVGYIVDNGPIRIVCTTCTNSNYDQILAALRVIWKEPGFRASYSEMMGLPAQALSSEYWFPWYNNAVPSSMDQGFRISVP